MFERSNPQRATDWPLSKVLIWSDICLDTSTVVYHQMTYFLEDYFYFYSSELLLQKQYNLLSVFLSQYNLLTVFLNQYNLLSMLLSWDNLLSELLSRYNLLSVFCVNIIYCQFFLCQYNFLFVLLSQYVLYSFHHCYYYRPGNYFEHYKQQL